MSGIYFAAAVYAVVSCFLVVPYLNRWYRKLLLR
jgi:hypothetical protein